MSGGFLKGRRVLAVDDEPEILDIVQEELEGYGVEVDRATSYGEGAQKVLSSSYDLVLLDIMGVEGFELLQQAVARKLPVIMITAHALSPETLKRSVELGARAYLPKDCLGQLVPFLEDVLTSDYHNGWKRVLAKLGGSFRKRFAPQWTKSEKDFFHKFEKDPDPGDSAAVDS